MRCLIVFILFAIVTPVAANAKSIDEIAGKCLPGIVKVMSGKYLPEHTSQKIVVQKKQESRSEPRESKEVICNYYITIVSRSKNGNELIPRWRWNYAGPGLVFTDGMWHNQNTNKILDVQSIHLHGSVDQVMIYSQDMAADGGYGDLYVFELIPDLWNYKTLLHVSGHGGLLYHVDGDILDIKGTYYGPNDCLACGHAREVKLHFDPEVGQLAIVNPDKDSAEFYKSIEAH